MNRFYCTIDEYGSVIIFITLKYLYYVLPFQRDLAIKRDLQIQIKICVVLWYVIKFLIDSKHYERFVCKILKNINSIISTYLCIYKIMENGNFNQKINIKNEK